MWNNVQLNAQVNLMNCPVLPDAPPKPVADVIALKANPGKVLADAINDYLYRHEDPARRGDAVVEMSFLLRQALSVDPDRMNTLPVQLGHDYKTARSYLISETIRWVQSDRLEALFSAVGLSRADAQTVREILPTAIRLECLAVWLCEEFGHLRAIRHATHARRYVATRMTTDIHGGPRPNTTGERSCGERLQSVFDHWANPLCEVETSLHYQKVIAPLTDQLIALGGAQNDTDGDPVAANSNEV